MGTTKLIIGKIPISKGEYQMGTTYQRLNQVTMLGSTYQSKIDDNTSAPAQMGADGAVENINTEKWLCIAVGNVSAARKVVYNNETSGLEAGNVQEAIDEVDSKVSDLSVVSSELSKDTTCISLKNKIIKGNLVNISTGKLNPSAEYDCTDFIPVNKSIYTTLPDMGSAVFYDSDKKYIKKIDPVTEHGLAKYVYDDDTIAYIRINQRKGNTELSYDNSYAIKADFIGNVCLGVEEETTELSKDITCISLKNRIIKGNLVNISTGKLNPSAEYDCTDFIPVNKSIYTTLPDMGSAVFYDSDKKYIKKIDPVTEHGLAKYVYDDDTIAYIRINQRKGNTELSYDNSYAIKADFIGNVCLGVEANSYNELYGKKWCCCGDSFSVAGYNVNDGIPQDVYVYQDGPYKGKQKVYGTMIALRNSMNFVNIANGGMTMCNIDGTRTNSFTYNDYYKKIPLDSDYVTIKFGINDGNFNSPIGTIDDEVVTTFYGAWNVVLKWIRNNLPFTKVGIIVSSGLGKTQSSDNLAEATRNVAQKWGIPILDEINDKTIPLLHRTNRPGISSDVYDLLIEKFSVNTATGNTHPNVKAHEFESTFVEAFIRKL